MQTPTITRRRARLEDLLKYTPVSLPKNMEDFSPYFTRSALEVLVDCTLINRAAIQKELDEILDNYDTPKARWAIWERIVERYEWLEAVENGADVDGEDRDLIAEQTEADLNTLLDQAEAA